MEFSSFEPIYMCTFISKHAAYAELLLVTKMYKIKRNGMHGQKIYVVKFTNCLKMELKNFLICFILMVTIFRTATAATAGAGVGCNIVCNNQGSGMRCDRCCRRQNSALGTRFKSGYCAARVCWCKIL